MDKKHILIVDDDPEIFHTLKKRLEFHGFNCTNASSVEKALEDLKEKKPDLVLLDLGFPGVDGTAFLKNARLHYSHEEDLPPILVLSCYNDPEIVDHVMEAGAKHYIPKPYDAAELVSTINRFLSP
jgi:DNA-binding response OmpR family regulator